LNGYADEDEDQRKQAQEGVEEPVAASEKKKLSSVSDGETLLSVLSVKLIVTFMLQRN